MHLGNLSLAIEGNVFRLLPLYDMCSMGFAPKGGGEVKPYDFVPAAPKVANRSVETSDNISYIAKSMARDFWERVATDSRISPEFKEFLKRGNPIDLMKESSGR